ncbi:MAG: hypothetical protein K6E73_10665 [Bacteroidales bacterium]|nr:hypothetical protein [Bacteroidales bacterium]
MEPITRPDIEKLVSNVAQLLRNGTYTVYEAIHYTFAKVNEVVDWLTSTADTLVSNEDERIAAENDRALAENDRVNAEAARVRAEELRVAHDENIANTYATKEEVQGAWKGFQSVEKYADQLVWHFDIIGGTDDETSELVEPATHDYAGLMSAADKTKLDALPTAVTLDSTYAKLTDIESKLEYLYAEPDAYKVTMKGFAVEPADAFEYENPTTSTEIPAATTSAAGVMTATDKTNLNSAVKGVSTGASSATQVKLSLTKVSGSASVPLPNAAMAAAGVITNVEWLALRALMRDTTMADYLTKRTTGWSVTLERGEALSVAIPTLQAGEKLYVKVNTSGERYNAIVLETSGSAASFTASAYCSVSGEWQEVTGLAASGVAVNITARYAASEEAYSEAVIHDVLDTLEQKQTNIEIQFLIAE